MSHRRAVRVHRINANVRRRSSIQHTQENEHGHMHMHLLYLFLIVLVLGIIQVNHGLIKDKLSSGYTHVKEAINGPHKTEAEIMREKLEEAINSTKMKSEQMCDQAKKAVESIVLEYEHVRESLGEKMGETRDMAGDTYDAAKARTSDTMSAVRDRVGDAVDMAKEKTSDAMSAARDKAGEAKRMVMDKEEALEEKAAGVAGWIKAGFERFREGLIMPIPNDLMEKAENMKEKTIDAARRTSEQMTEQYKKAMRAANVKENKLEKDVDGMGDKISNAAGTVKDGIASGYERAKEGLGMKAKEAKSKAEMAMQAGAAKKAAEEKKQHIKANVEGVGEAIKEKVVSGYEYVKEGFGMRAEDAKEAAERAKSEAEAQGFGQKVSNAAGSVKDTIVSGYEHIKEGLSMEADDAQWKAEQAKAEAEAQKRELEKKAGGIGSKVKDSLAKGYERVKKGFVFPGADAVDVKEKVEDVKEKAKEAKEKVKDVKEKVDEQPVSALEMSEPDFDL